MREFSSNKVDSAQSKTKDSQTEVPHPLNFKEAKALPLGWLLAPKTNAFSERVLARLIQSEAHEPDVSLREDYRQAFITVSLAAKGNASPFVEASYLMYGVHPEKLYGKVLAQREAMLGPEAGECAPQPSPIRALPGSPKKPVQSVGIQKTKEA